MAWASSCCTVYGTWLAPACEKLSKGWLGPRLQVGWHHSRFMHHVKPCRDGAVADVIL